MMRQYRQWPASPANLVNPVLTPADIRQILHDACRVLNEVGVRCEHTRLIRELKEKSRTVYTGTRLHFDLNDLEAYIEDLQQEFQAADRPSDPDAFSMGGSWNCLELCDPVENRPRPATNAEAIEMARLSEALGAASCPIPVAPGETPPRLKTLASERIALTHTRGLGGWLTATDPEEIRIIAEMFKAAGRKYSLGLEGFITPLKINSEVYDTYFEWRDDPDIDIRIMGGIPVAGSTAPLAFPSNLVLALAESFGLDFISRILSDGRDKCLNFRLELFDMKYANLVYGSPEHNLTIQAVRELVQGLFGTIPRGGAFRTNGKIIDAQTILERTSSFLWQATLGSRRFSAVGQLSMDEVFSPVAAVLDRELLRYGQRLFAGISSSCWIRDIDPVDIIREGIDADGFLLHDTTLDVFRNFFAFDRLCAADNLGTWRSKGSRPLEAQAWDEARKLIRANDYELDEIARKEIDKLYERGALLLCR